MYSCSIYPSVSLEEKFYFVAVRAYRMQCACMGQRLSGLVCGKLLHVQICFLVDRYRDNGRV